MIFKKIFREFIKTAPKMSNTLTDSLTTSISDFYINHVSAHLSDWLKTNKDCECTPEELCGAFGLAYTPRANMAGLPQAANMATQMPNIPGYLAGTGASPAPRKGGGRKKAPADPNAPKCIYTFQRGDKKGQSCGLAVAQNGEPGGEDYCKGCLKKKTVQAKIKSGSSERSTVQPPVVPGGMVPVPEQEQSGGGNTIKAVPIEGQPGMYKDLDTGFILQQRPDESIVAIAMEENGGQRPLTDDEKKAAQLRGLSILDSPVAESQTPESVPSIPTVPQVETAAAAVPTIPTIPQVGVVQQ